MHYNLSIIYVFLPIYQYIYIYYMYIYIYIYREHVSNWARFQLSSFTIEFDSISFGRNKIQPVPGRNRPFYIDYVRNASRLFLEQRKKVYSTRCMLRNRLFCKVFEPFISGIDLECRKKVYSTRRALRNRLFCNVFEPLISGIDPEYRKKGLFHILPVRE